MRIDLKRLLIGGALMAVAAEKAVFCKHCGRQAASVRTLTANKCSRHPGGAFKSPHAPAL